MLHCIRMSEHVGITRFSCHHLRPRWTPVLRTYVLFHCIAPVSSCKSNKRIFLFEVSTSRFDTI